MEMKKNVLEFVIIAFLLLGALFGMQIMSFIFVNLGPSATGLTAADVGYNQSLEIQNDSLNAIQNYSSQAGTQFNTVGIAITLVVLIALFFIFWKIFVKGKSGKGGDGGSFA